jgi:hypothetical protein
MFVYINNKGENYGNQYGFFKWFGRVKPFVIDFENIKAEVSLSARIFHRGAPHFDVLKKVRVTQMGDGIDSEISEHVKKALF